MQPLQVILSLLLLGGGLSVLQVYLSSRPARYWGLILPGVLIVAGVIAALVYTTMSLGESATVAAILLAIFLLCIPALSMLALYGLCRTMRKSSSV